MIYECKYLCLVDFFPSHHLSYFCHSQKFLTLILFEDKGDAIDAEAGSHEEDFLIQDEIYKSRLASIKRVSCYLW